MTVTYNGIENNFGNILLILTTIQTYRNLICDAASYVDRNVSTNTIYFRTEISFVRTF